MNEIVRRLQGDLPKLGQLIGALRQLLDAIADRQRFQMRYRGGSVILDCARLGAEGGRALSYRDATLTDAVLRVALDDIYEDVDRALQIRRCAAEVSLEDYLCIPFKPAAHIA